MIRTAPSDTGKPLLGNDQYMGYCKDLADAVALACDFVYHITPVKDGKFGSFDNNTWNGMIGELVRKVSVRKPSPTIWLCWRVCDEIFLHKCIGIRGVVKNLRSCR